MQRRSGAGRIAAAGIAVALGVGAARGAEACPLPCPFEPPAVALAEADAVFQGKVVGVAGPALDDYPAIRRAIRDHVPGAIRERLLDGWTTYVFEVQSSWKGVESTRITLEDEDSYPAFTEGETYLVYARLHEGHLVSPACSRTTTLARATVDLAALGPASIALHPPRSRWALFAAAGAAPLLVGLSLLAGRRLRAR